MPRGVALAALAAALAGCSRSTGLPPGRAVARPAPAVAPTVTPQASGTTQRLQAVSAASSEVVWVSGVGGTFAVTTDGGQTWRAGVVPGGEALEFRDVQAVSATMAYLMSAGNGADSRIYRTVDGGVTWTLQFQNRHPVAFYDCFAFWAPERGIAFSDAVDGRFPVLRTTDGIAWDDIGDRLPSAQAKEGGFAASGTCVAVQGERRGWIATGGAERARVLATTDGGESWTAHETPIVQGREGAGGFSVAFRGAEHGVLVGGDLGDSGKPAANVAVTRDGGRSWALASPTPFPGAAFGVSYVPGLGGPTVVATGPGGVAWSADEGASWTLIPGVENYWAVGFAGPTAGWLVGTEGRILKLVF